jgi:aldehyde:ferredoxin oxidoreductase
LALVDLEYQKGRTSPISDDEQQQFIGGFGLDVPLAMRYIPQGAYPFSFGNPIIISSAALAGTSISGVSRFSVVTKLPLNGAIGGNIPCAFPIIYDGVA